MFFNVLYPYGYNLIDYNFLDIPFSIILYKNAVIL
jgi:hypothetical protein